MILYHKKCYNALQYSLKNRCANAEAQYKSTGTELKMDTSFKQNIIRLDITDSTNEEAFRINSVCAVTALRQSAGKGRNGRSFVSSGADGLWLSVLEKDIYDPQLTTRTAVAVCRALDKLAPLPYEIKWPNDILLQGKKLCGILTERRGDSVVIGIGVNLYQEDFGELKDIATSLRLNGAEIDREVLLSEILNGLAALMKNYDSKEEELEYYRSHCCCMNCDIWLIAGDKKAPAHSCGINDNFELLISSEGSSPEPLCSGEISLRLR